MDNLIKIPSVIPDLFQMIMEESDYSFERGLFPRDHSTKIMMRLTNKKIFFRIC